MLGLFENVNFYNVIDFIKEIHMSSYLSSIISEVLRQSEIRVKKRLQFFTPPMYTKIHKETMVANLSQTAVLQYGANILQKSSTYE